jgi:hypothetical protein
LIGSTLPAMLFKFNLLGGLRGRETGDQYCRPLGFNQAIIHASLTRKKCDFRGVRTTLRRAPRCVFHITGMHVSLQQNSRRRQMPAVTVQFWFWL